MMVVRKRKNNKKQIQNLFFFVFRREEEEGSHLHLPSSWSPSLSPPDPTFEPFFFPRLSSIKRSANNLEKICKMNVLNSSPSYTNIYLRAFSFSFPYTLRFFFYYPFSFVFIYFYTPPSPFPPLPTLL